MTGETTSRGKLVGLIGAGIGPSLSPALHEAEAAKLGLPYMYRLIDLDQLGVGSEATGELMRAARTLGFDGLNVTHPCKQTVLAELDELSPDAAALGAVNTVVLRDGRAVGHNTDWSGFASSLTRNLPEASLEHVALLGAGGAGAAVGYALAWLGTRRLTIMDAERARATALADTLRACFVDTVFQAAGIGELRPVLDSADGIVHATPTGMAAHPGIAVPPAALRRSLWVADIVYRPIQTRLVTSARAAGCPTLDGGGMAVFQAADSMRLFSGIAPDTNRMLAHFNELIEREVHQDASDH